MVVCDHLRFSPQYLLQAKHLVHEACRERMIREIMHVHCLCQGALDPQQRVLNLKRQTYAIE